MRVYLPATTTVLRRLVEEGALPGPHTVFAVTPQLRRFYELNDADADLEELEYAALLGAARASLRLIDNDPTAARRRVVVAADVPDDAVRPIDDADTDRGQRASRPTSGCRMSPAHTSTARTPRTTSGRR
ncbi:DUF6912 family protein [Blastococcus brunescens]|uniref:Uncharacterized protein n=1 Tax=Blastococcus brunescens TaxID=1564165 RepID=A0ABZ1AZC5_9ACTN|nr:hypothetical protein [Blastococcus sp. BMG 8361]WRL62836.1 hypothetical protein U6N30_23560 [Blastococcus sp. BMG 8361]